MSVTERCEVVLEDGTKGCVDILVNRRIHLSIDCRCYSHRTGIERFQIVVTPGGAYVRAEGNDGFFKALDASGPLVLEIQRSIQE